jgi:CheY-like chemotaxis protein
VHSAGENSGCTFSVEVGMQRKGSNFHCDDALRTETFNTFQTLQCESKEVNAEEIGAEMRLGGIIKLNGQASVVATHESGGLSVQSLGVIGNGIPFPTKPIYNILMVDDSALNRKLLGKLLRISGHIVEEAEDGLQVVEIVKANREADKVYDVILMDFMMPKLDGPSATKVIRDLGYTSPIFGVTGNAVESDVDFFLAHGADRVMIKPFNFQLFNQNMAEMIAARASL